MAFQHKGEEVLVNTTVFGGQIGPKIARLANGSYVVTWLDTSNVNRGQVFDSDGNKVGDEFVLGSGWKVAALADGGFVALSGDGQHIILQMFDDEGNAAGPPFAAADIVGYPWAIAGFDSGGFVVVWDYDQVLAGNEIDDSLSLRGQLFDSAGAPIGEDFAVGDSPGEGNNPEVTVLAGGGFVVTWENDGHIEAQLFGANGAKAGGDFPVSGGEPGMADPQVAALESGGFVIVWTRHAGLDAVGFRGVFAQVYDSSGAPVGGEIMVSPEGPSTQVSLDVGALAGGGFVVTWASKNGDGDGMAVRAQVYDCEGAPLGAGLTVNTIAADDQIQPVVTGLASGDFVIVWADGSGSGGDTDPFAIRSQLFHYAAPIEGSWRDELLRGSALEDEIYGYGGDDELRGGAGNDLLDGGDGDDLVRGGAGDDVLRLSGLGDDFASGGAGDDTLIVDFSESWTSVDSSWGPIANADAGGFDGGFQDEGWRQVTYTSIERFIVTGGLADDHLVTADGDDSIDGGCGDDVMAGGRGNDVYRVDSLGDVVVELAGEGIDEIRTGLGRYVLAANVENLYATSDVDHDFRGNAGNNVILGGAGSDFLRLQDGGYDKAIGGAGNDVFYFGATYGYRDMVDGGAGKDQLALQGDYSSMTTLDADSVESVALLPGSDTRFGDTAGNLYSYNIRAWEPLVGAGETVVIDANRLRVGENFNFDGSAETDGAFFIYGGRGTDTLTGGAMNDTFYFGENKQFGATDRVDGGSGGIDQLGLRGNYTIVFGAAQLTSIESIGLVSAMDTRFGSAGTTYQYNLTMNDANLAAGARMTIDAAPLRAGETLTFDGSAESDGSFRIFGGAGNDVIKGGAQADSLTGGLGGDSLTGGGGNDLFIYRSVAESTLSGRDSIRDFTTGDRIDFSRIDANADAAGDQAFMFVGSAAFTGTAGELRAFLAGEKWTVQGDVNGDGVADFEVTVVVSDAHPIVGSDFIL